MPSPSDTPIYSALSESEMYRDYQDAFQKTTGLPLRLHLPEEDLNPLVRPGFRHSHFCVLMANKNSACEACLALQQTLESQAQLKPKTLKCFAGLCETAVPVRVGEKVIAFLQTGGILLETPSHREFSKITRELLRLGAFVDLKEVEEAYFALRVITIEQYQSMVKLLAIFASHLAACGNQLVLKRTEGQNTSVSRGRAIIDAGYKEELSLGGVAKQVNVSAGYFSLLFKKATGMNFVEYVARFRVEKAKGFLHNPKFRISEIAFNVGFQSLSQFNRTFVRFEGVSPRLYRSALEETTSD